MLNHPDHIKGVVYAVLMTLLSATAMAAIKYLSTDLSVELITFQQYLVCLIIACFALQKISRQQNTDILSLLLVNRGDRMTMFIRCAAGLLGFYTLYISVARISLVESTLLRNSSPLFVPILAGFILHTHTNWVRWLIILFGFSGIYLILFPQGFTTQSGFDWGYIAGIASAFFLAISMILTNILGNKYSPQNILFYYYLLSVVGMLPLAIHYWQWPTPLQWALLIYVGIAIHGALYLYTLAFSLVSPAVVAPLTYLSIVHAGIIGYFWWGDIPQFISIIGMVIVVISGIATTLYKTETEKLHK